MDKSVNVLNPLLVIKIKSGRQVEVKELTWKDYLRATRELTDAVLKLVTPDGKMELDKPKIIEVITRSEDLAGWVIEKSTSLTQAEVNELSGAEFLNIMQAVVELNFSEEVVGASKKLAGRVGAVLGLKIASPKPSTSSSPRVTA